MKQTKHIMNRVLRHEMHLCLNVLLALLMIIATYLKFQWWVVPLGTFIVIVYSICNGMVFYRHIMKPYQRIEKYLYSYNQGYNTKIMNMAELSYSTEMERSIHKIRKALDSHNAIQLSSKRAEYRVLQNQINPHFLYNTLESIRSDALSEGAENIADITEALATFFRYTVTKSEHLVTLEAELANAENYFMIQKYRFGDRIDMVIECDEEVYGYLIPKLTLQPIIENGIIHGIEPKLEKGHLHIKVTQTEDRLIIQIGDDGVGMEESTVLKINEGINQINSDEADVGKLNKGGIALINVNNRMKMLFGEKYGIRLTSVKGFGTTVDVTVPLKKSQNV